MNLRSACLSAIFAVFARGEALTIDRALSLAEQYNPQLRAATASVAGAEAGIVTARKYPNPEFGTGLGRQQVSNELLLAFEAGALKEADAALQGAEAAFRFGERGIIEVLDAQRVLRGVRLDYLNAQYDRQAALIELEGLEAIDLGKTP